MKLAAAILLATTIPAAASEPFGLDGGNVVPYYQQHASAALETLSRDKLKFDKCVANTADCTLGMVNFFHAITVEGPIAAKLGKVNLNLNMAIKAVPEVGAADVWQGPLETLEYGGDCEDYAIAKVLAFHWLGIDFSDMRLVVVYVPKLKQRHVVLAANVNGQWRIYDNTRLNVLQDTEVKDYVPMYSIQINVNFFEKSVDIASKVR